MKKIFISSAVCFLFIVFAKAQNVGIGTNSPAQKLDVNGKVKLGDDANAPQSGTIRWNNATSDFEGFNGSSWLSLTQKNSSSSFVSQPWPTTACTGTGTISDYRQASSIDGAAGDSVGFSVAISGDYAVVGAPGDNTKRGAAYVYHRSGNSWVQEAKLIASDGSNGDAFGFSVAIDGDYIIAGVPIAAASAGKAYIFKRTGTNWAQEQILTEPTPGTSHRFGFSVSISGNTVLIGADNSTGIAATTGTAYTYLRTGAVWALQSQLSASDGLALDEFGFSVSLSGDYAVIGAKLDDNGVATNQGSAYIFKRTGSTWAQQAKILSSDGVALDQFGFSVSISGDYVVVGSPFQDLPFISAGAVYIFKRNGIVWTEEKKLSAPDATASDQFGCSVAVSGEYIIAGAKTADVTSTCPGTHTTQGKAYIFRLQPGGLTDFVATVFDPAGLTNDNLGVSVGISGNLFVCGANLADINSRVNQGKVVFGQAN